MHRQFLRIKSQNPDYVTTHCNDLKILFILHVVNGQQKITHNILLGIKILQKQHWQSLMSTFSNNLQGPFLVMFPIKSSQHLQTL